MKTNDRIAEAKRVTWVGFFINLVLSIGKVLAGLLGKSSAMIADGLHSLSDFVTDLIVLCFIGISGKVQDEDHDYGHGKFETLATLIVSVMLIGVGIGMGWGGIQKVIDATRGVLPLRPTYLALAAALVSILVKEGLYWYTILVGRRIRSDAVIANAWHHRSDAFSSIGTFVGISGAMFLGDKFRILDPIACLIVSLLIVYTGIQLLIPAVKELLESSLSKEIEDEIMQIILGADGVCDAHHLKTRKNGNCYIIDVHIKVDPDITVKAGHDISHKVEEQLRLRFGSNLQTSIHIEPFKITSI